MINKYKKFLRLLVILCLAAIAPYVVFISLLVGEMVYNYFLSDLAFFSYKISIGEPFESVEPKVLAYYEKNKLKKSHEIFFAYQANGSEKFPGWHDGKYLHIAEEAPFFETHPIELYIFFDKNDRVENMLFSAD